MILDDWFDTLRGLRCFAKRDGHDVEIWNDHVEDEDVRWREARRHCSRLLASRARL